MGQTLPLAGTSGSLKYEASKVELVHFMIFTSMRENTHHNYLRTLRKRSGLTEVQIALLLGSQTWSKVSRHELGITTPSLADLAAYQLIYGLPLRTIFSPAFCLARAALAHRAAALIVQEEAGMKRKIVIETLSEIVQRCKG